MKTSLSLFFAVLFFVACKPDDGPVGSDSLLVLQVDMNSVIVNPDMSYVASISDLDGNVLDTKPINNKEINLGENFSDPNRPEKLVLHIFRIITPSGTSDKEIALSSYSNIITGSEFNFNPNKSSTTNLKDATLLIDAEGETFTNIPSASPFSFVSTNRSTGLLAKTNQTEYATTLYFEDTLQTKALAVIRTENNPDHYYWELIPFSIGDTSRVQFSDLNQVTTNTHRYQVLPAPYSGANCYFYGNYEGNLYQFDTRTWSTNSNLSYTVPGINFEEYKSIYLLRTPNQVFRRITTSSLSPETTFPVPSIDIQFSSSGTPYTFDYSTSGPVSYSQAIWTMDSTSVSGQDFYFGWVFNGPSSNNLLQVKLPKLDRNWLPELDWVESRDLFFGLYSAYSITGNPNYETWVQAQLDLNNSSQLFSIPHIGNISEQVTYQNP